MRKAAWMTMGIGIVVIGCGADPIDYGAPQSYATDAGIQGSGGACQFAGQCPSSKPVCDPVTHTCVGCTASNQCRPGLACVGGQCSACTSNDQCAVGLVCTNGTCGACSSSAQCLPGYSCNNGACTQGMQAPTDGGVGTGNCTLAFPGSVGPVGSVWGNAATASPSGFGNGLTGKAAGDGACSTIYGAGAHACTWEEVKTLDACGKLVTQKNVVETAWMHRTAAETASATHVVDDNPSLQPGAPAKGGRCNDWTYPTNHAFDGEFIEFGGGVMKGHFDSDTADDNGATSTHAAAGVLECNGMLRKVLCCK